MRPWVMTWNQSSGDLGATTAWSIMSSGRSTLPALTSAPQPSPLTPWHSVQRSWKIRAPRLISGCQSLRPVASEVGESSGGAVAAISGSPPKPLHAPRKITAVIINILPSAITSAPRPVQGHCLCGRRPPRLQSSRPGLSFQRPLAAEPPTGLAAAAAPCRAPPRPLARARDSPR